MNITIEAIQQALKTTLKLDKLEGMSIQLVDILMKITAVDQAV